MKFKCGQFIRLSDGDKQYNYMSMLKNDAYDRYDEDSDAIRLPNDSLGIIVEIFDGSIGGHYCEMIRIFADNQLCVLSSTRCSYLAYKV